jgi:hypothetical protein
MKMLALILILAAAATASAQTNTGEIGGIVKDASGGVIPGTTVTAKRAATGTALTRITDNEGRFFFPALQPGAWDMAVSLPGFTTQTRNGIPLEIGKTLSLEFTLEVASVTQSVVLDDTDNFPLLDIATAEISDVIQNREIIQTPLNGRNFIALAQLSDGVVLPPGGTRGEALQQAGPLPNVGGQRSGHNIYLLDGVKVTDELFNNLVINPSVDSIQEFKIQKSMYPAEFGGKASALINVATRGGTNVLHGSLFEFHRNDAFDERNYFARNLPKPPLRQNQFGGTLGGALKQNQTFFFVSYEGLRMRRSLTKTFTVPGDAVRTGDFSGLGNAIRDPQTGLAFPGNIIPANRIDPIASVLLAKVPRAPGAGPTPTLTSVEKSTRDIDQFSARLDHSFSYSHRVFGRFSTFDADDLQPFGTSSLNESLVPGFGRTLRTQTRNLALSHTHPFNSSMLNELRFGWLRVKGGQESLNRGFDFAAQTGLLGVTTDARDVGYPQISTSGLYSTMGDPTVFTHRNNEHFEVFENFMIARGAHHLKFGAYFFHLKMRPEQPDNARGAFSFTGQFTGNALADFLLGYPGSATSGIGRGGEDARTNWWHFYVQDDWKARHNLTFNVGLRVEHNQHMTEVNNRLASIDVKNNRFVISSDDNGNIDASAQALLPLIPIPYVTSKEAGWNPGLLKDSPIRMAPRLGFSLSLADAKTVVRGGYGIFLNQWAYSVQTAFARTLPFFFTKQVDVPLTTTTPTLFTRNSLTTNATGTVGGSTMNHDYKVEYSQTWSVGLQQALGRSTALDLSYMGTWTIGADNAGILNVPAPGAGSIAARRQIPQLSRINTIRFDGKSIYHGGTFKIERRMRNNFAYNVSYTLSRSRDDASSPGPTESETNFPQDVNNLFGRGGEWARSSFDHRHQFVASGVVEFPFFRNAGGVREGVFGGWRVNPVWTGQTGAPFTVNLSVDQANVGAGPAQRPDQLRNPTLPAGERTADHWFDTTAFVLPAQFTFGDAPRNSVIGPGFSNVDLAISKTWALGEPAKLEFRWETFNVLNRTNFDLPNRTFSPSNTNFGRIFSAKSPREMQFGLRLSF